MKTKIFFVSLILLAQNIFAQNSLTDLAVKLNRKAVIIIDTLVFNDDSVSVKITGGFHEIKIKRDLRSWNLDTIIDTLIISGEEKNIVKNYNIPEVVFINSLPPGAKVFTGSNYIGSTPLFLRKNSGPVRLIKENFKSVTVNSPDKPFTFNLKKINHTVKENNFTEDIWFKVLLGGIVGAGATSAYFKLKADKFYDEYLHTKDESLLSKTNNYDLISGIALGVLQVNFGLLIYHFLIE